MSRANPTTPLRTSTKASVLFLTNGLLLLVLDCKPNKRVSKAKQSKGNYNRPIVLCFIFLTSTFCHKAMLNIKVA